jgi:hypothetical protein
LAFLAVAALAAALAAPSRGADARVRVLDVPYLSQTTDLCGGAAAAMVLRYWGVPATAEEFAPLVDARRRGILASDLVLALQRRGVSATPFRGEPTEVQRQLAQGRPVIALIGVDGGLLHYVVLLAWHEGRVLLHDPARAPFQVLLEAELLKAWQAGERWALVVTRDAAATGTSAAATPTAEEPAAPCSELVREGVALARSGQPTPAEERLQAAAALCPEQPAPVLELAGLRFQAQRWDDAARLAEQAARRDPRDPHAWQTLAAARYLSGDGRGALPAFNRLGEPKLGLLKIDGLTRTRHRALEDRIALPGGSLLTARELDRARRRLQELPALRSSRVDYRPTGDGGADLEIAVVERPLLPRRPGDLLRLATRAVFERELELGLASPAGAGDWVGFDWRFPAPRRALGVAVIAPAPLRSSALLEARLRWDTQSYADDGALAPVREKQREAALSLSDWTRAGVRWELGASLQRFDGRRSFVAPSLALELRPLADRLALRASAATFAATGGDRGFSSLAIEGGWRSRADAAARLRARAAGRLATDGAPLLHWSGAGTGPGRPELLRAHPLLRDDVVAGSVFGRRLLAFGIEWEPLRRSVGPLRLGVAAFADAAAATRRRAPGTASEVDAGIGLRLALPGAAGALRVDFARGLRDGRQALSAGWQKTWPGLHAGAR